MVNDHTDFGDCRQLWILKDTVLIYMSSFLEVVFSQKKLHDDCRHFKHRLSGDD